MAQIQKILGQATGTVTATAVYTVPALTSTVISSIIICNTSATGTTATVVISKAGEALSTKQYILYNQNIEANSTFTLTVGITLAATDIIKVLSPSTSVAFNIFGMEVS